MFSLHNVKINKDTVIRVSYGDRPPLEYALSALIKKRVKEDLDNEEEQFRILNGYLDYKGDAYKEELYSIMNASYIATENLIYSNNDTILPYFIIHNILNHFDFQDVFYYISNVYKLIPPNHLPDVFDNQIESDARGSRVQTYTKNDYLELATLCIIIKATLGPLANLSKIKQNNVVSTYREYYLFSYFRPHWISETEPMQKLLGFINKLIEHSTESDKESLQATRVLENDVSVDELPYKLLGTIIIQKIAITSLVNDDQDKNIVNKIYNYVKTKLKPDSNLAKNIKEKTSFRGTDSSAGDKESTIESYRGSEDISSSMAVEMDWAVDSVEKVVKYLPIEQRALIDEKVLNDAIIFTKNIVPKGISRIQIILLCVIFKKIIDPRSLDFITLNSLYNLFAVGFAYLWGAGDKRLAAILTSNVDSGSENSLTINMTVNKTRLDKALKAELDVLFPHQRVIGNDSYANVAEESINDLSDNIYKSRWNPTAYEKYIKEVVGGEYNIQSLVTDDMKSMLAIFLINHERRIQNAL